MPGSGQNTNKGTGLYVKRSTSNEEFNRQVIQIHT